MGARYPRMPEPQVSARVGALIVRAATALGADLGRLLAATGFDPAVLDDLDPKAEPESGQQSGVATAVGGARPSSVAVPGKPVAGTKTKAKTRLPVGK